MLKLSGVTHPDGQDITAMLAAWNGGDGQALDRLMEITYPKLRQVARQYLAGRRPGDSLESAALANEAYLKLVRSGGIRCDNKAHFLALCSQMIRRILVDHVRRKKSLKGGGGRARVELRDDAAAVPERSDEILAVDEALAGLAAADPQAAELVKLRYFAGLSVEEAAELTGLSRSTAYEHWSYARAWLLCRLEGRPDRATP